MPVESAIPAPVIWAVLAWLAFRVIQGKLRAESSQARPASDFQLGPLMKPFIKAVFAGSVFAIGMQMALPGLGMGAASDSAAGSLIERFAVLVMMPALVTIMAPVALVCGLATKALRVPRGIADCLAGALAGSSAWLGDIIMGRGSFAELLSAGFGSEGQMMALSFTLGGCVAGYTFWAAQGYPGGQ